MSRIHVVLKHWHCSLPFKLALLCMAFGVSPESHAQVTEKPSAATVAPTATPAPQREARTRLRFGADWQLASWLVADYQGQAALARFATSHLSAAEAKRRAQLLMEEYEQMLERLRPFTDLQQEAETASEQLLAKPAAEQVRATAPQTLPQPTASTPAKRNATSDHPATSAEDSPHATVDVTTSSAATPIVPVPAATVPTPAVGGDAKSGVVVVAKMAGSGFDLVGLKRELASENLKSSQDALEALSGDDAERWFFVRQVAWHSEQLDTLRVFRLHASNRLQLVIDEEAAQVASQLQRAQDWARRYHHVAAPNPSLPSRESTP